MGLMLSGNLGRVDNGTRMDAGDDGGGINWHGLHGFARTRTDLRWGGSQFGTRMNAGLTREGEGEFIGTDWGELCGFLFF